MKADHPLRKRYETKLSELREQLDAMENKRFRLFQKAPGSPEIDITEDAKRQTREAIALFESILAL